MNILWLVANALYYYNIKECRTWQKEEKSKSCTAEISEELHHLHPYKRPEQADRGVHRGADKRVQGIRK